MNFPRDYECNSNIWIPAGGRSKGAEFSYSDGSEVEARLLETIKGAEDRSLFSTELKNAIVDWPSRYHLSVARANLLRPFAEVLSSRVLEVGAGCGAITRFLGELGADVVAIEGSPLRATMARERTLDLPNVTVVCDRVQNFSVRKKFDVITLIGVLEYARMYMESGEQPEVRLLSHLRSLLKPNGVLLIAIENQLGMKYFAGAEEDHLGVEFFGVNDLYSAKSAATFGKAELTNIMEAAAFPSHQFYLPFPDYKLPSTVFAPEAILRRHNFDPRALISESCRLDHQNPTEYVFSLEKAWGVLSRNGLVTEHANSFLAVASQTPEGLAKLGQPEAVAWHYAVERHPAFTKQAMFSVSQDGVTVRRRPLSDIAAPDVPLECKINDERYVQGATLWAELVDIVNRPGWTSKDIANWAREWIDFVGASAGVQQFASESVSTLVDGKLFDATPFNLVRDTHGNLSLIDQEWSLRHKIEFGYLVFRGLFNGMIRITSMAEPGSGTPRDVGRLLLAVFQQLGIFLSRADVNRWAGLESRVQQWAQGNTDEGFRPEADEQLWTQSLSFRSAVERRKLARQVEGLRQELVQRAAETNALRADLSQGSNEADTESERLRGRVADLERELRETQTETARQLEIAGKGAAIHQAESERVHAYIGTLEQQLLKVQSDAAHRLEEAARGAVAQQAESERAHAYIGELEKQLKEIRAETGRQLQDAATSAVVQQTESERARAFISDLEFQLKTLRTETARQLTEAATAAATQQAESERTHAYIAELELLLKEVRSESASRLEVAAAAVASHQTEAERFHAQINNLSVQLRTMQADAVCQLEAASAASVAQQIESERAHGYILTLEDQLRAIQEEMQFQAKTLREEDEREATAAKALIESQRAELQSSAAELENLQVEMQSIATQLAASQTRNCQLIDEVTGMQQELTTLRATSDSSEGRLALVEQKLIEARTEISEAAVQRDLSERIVRQQAVVVARMQREALNLRNLAPAPAQALSGLLISRLHPGLKRVIPIRVKQFIKSRLFNIK